MSKRLVLGALLLSACAPHPQEKKPMDVPPKQTVAGGDAGERALGAKMAAMSADADAIIARAKAGGAAAYPGAVLEICFAMRPEFGPANGALPRQKKLDELARALGIDPAKPPANAGDRVDDFVRQVRDLETTIRAKGLQIEDAPSPASALLWTGGMGWRVLVTDPSREVDEVIAYAPPSGKKVHPRVTLWFFEHRSMNARASMVTREQPGEPEAAGDAWFAFTLQSPQSHDQDPRGELRASLLSLLTPGAAPGAELPAIATSVGAESARLERGILTVHTAKPLAKAPVPPAGAHALLTLVESGGTNHELVLQPL